MEQGGRAAGEVRQLFDRVNPTLPVLLANLIGVGQVALTYHAGLEQLLVLLPQAVATIQAIDVPNRNTKQGYKGAFLSFNLRLNLPPPCLTGFLPAQQQRVPSFEDYPDRPAGDLYCRVPQDSPQNVRGVRNIPCVDHPGKRAPTVQMCDSDESYVPLNDGYNWKGDPNATLSGQPVPQLPPGIRRTRRRHHPEPLPIAAAEYDPATGTYVGPDGHVYTQSDLAHDWRKGAHMANDAAAAELIESPTGRRRTRSSRRHAAHRLALAIGLLIVVALSGLVGSAGFRAYQAHQAQEQRRLFLEAGRQGAVNLTTIDFREADADVQRILDGATGQLYDNFSKRSQPFIDVVLRTQSKSVGTVTEAAVESQSGDQAEVLVAVTVQHLECRCAATGAARLADAALSAEGRRRAKVSNVEFVP